MEVLLESYHQNKKAVAVTLHNELSPIKVANAFTHLVRALGQLRDENGDVAPTPATPATAPAAADPSNITADWLLYVCARVPSELGTARLAQAIWDACQLHSEAQQQAALFELLGESEAAMDALFDVASHSQEIQKFINKSDLRVAATDELTTARALANIGFQNDDILQDPERQRLRQEALDAAHIAAITKAEAESMAPAATPPPPPAAAPGVTHTVTIASCVQAQKNAQKTAKRAAQALKRARDAGAIVDENDLMVVQDNTHVMGTGGVMGMTQEQLLEMQESLLPEGSRQAYDQQGLPRGTIRTTEGNLERVIIPPTNRDESSLCPRLKIIEIMHPTEAIAFAGTEYLNPMQSTIFEVAFKTRLNMLVCAPTGAG